MVIHSAIHSAQEELTPHSCDFPGKHLRQLPPALPRGTGVEEGELSHAREPPPAGHGCHSPAQTEELHLADEWKLLGRIILSQKIPYILRTSSANEICE